MGVLADARNVLLTADPREKAAAARKQRKQPETISPPASRLPLWF